MPTDYSPVAPELPAVEAAALARPRNDALDFTKGALVVIMVIYHWLNYFISIYGNFYRYLRFLPPSFILITGFLISNIYLAKYGAAGRRLMTRLATRGLKLLAVFLGLNVCGTLAFQHAAFLRSLPDQAGGLLQVMLSGRVPILEHGKMLSFTILVPISYLLIFAGLVAWGARIYKPAFHSVAVLLLVIVALLKVAGIDIPNLNFLAVGSFGVLLGGISIDRLDRAVRARAPLLLLAYVLYLAAITFWGTPYLLELAGVGITVLLLYLLGLYTAAFSPGRTVVLLGKYSLFGYISQIAVLQVLRRSLRGTAFSREELALTFVTALALTVLSVVAVHHARSRLRFLDRAYQAIFA